MFLSDEKQMPVELIYFSHPNFGKGYLVTEDANTITINFETVGEKRLIRKFSNLTPINSNDSVEIKPIEQQKPVDKKPRKPTIKIDNSVIDTNIIIVKETPKAYQLKKDGIVFWVQKRWYDVENFRLTKQGFESFKEAKEKVDFIGGVSDGVVYKNFVIVSEGEKATKLATQIDNGKEIKDIEFFAPNSQVVKNFDSNNNLQIGLNIEFYKQKLTELFNQYGCMVVSDFMYYEGIKTQEQKRFPKIRETEKAIGFEVNVDYVDIEKERQRVIWFPTSQISKIGNEYFVPIWMFEKSLENFMENIGSKSNSVSLLGYVSTKYGSVKVDIFPTFQKAKFEFI